MSRLDAGPILFEELQAFVGKSSGAPSIARDAVNIPMIRHLADALGDRNPVYVDEEFAGRSVHGGIVAPATSLQVWTMRGLAPPAEACVDDGASVADDGKTVSLLDPMRVLDEAGFSSVVATNCEQDYPRYLRPGDLVSVSSVIESISDRKRTALGEGHFVTTLQTYRDQRGEVVGEMRFRILKFVPVTRGDTHAASAPSRPPLPVPLGPTQATPSSGIERRRNTLSFDDVAVGAPIGELVIPLTPLLIVSTAIATRDYQDVHHDRDLAQQKGSKDIFMNILSTNGFVGRYVTDWAGPEAVLERVAIRLGAPNYPYDTMRLKGTVTSVLRGSGDRGTVELDVLGANSLGDHVVGHVRLTLPAGRA